MTVSAKMTKVTKKMLKSVVKECLVEILSEGIGDKRPILKESSPKKSSRSQRKKTIFDQMDESFEREPEASDNNTFGNSLCCNIRSSPAKYTGRYSKDNFTGSTTARI